VVVLLSLGQALNICVAVHTQSLIKPPQIAAIVSLRKGAEVNVLSFLTSQRP